MNYLDRFYSWLPVPLQHAAITAFGIRWYWLRFGPGYRKAVEEFRLRDRFAETDWKAWQQARVRRLLEIAVERVPGYRDRWSATERAEAARGRLDGLPLLEKALLREDPWAFVREDRGRKRPWVFHTSGSTGTPIATIWVSEEKKRSLALREVRSAGWAGTSFSRPRSTFSGRMVVPHPESRGPFHRYNAVESQVYFSAFHLRRETAEAYVRALHRHGVQWMTGYAVSHHLLARHMLELGLRPPPLRAVVTTSEKLTTRMREDISRAFSCRVYEEYSTVENALFASECEQGSLHVSPDAGVVELLRPDGSPCEPGEVGEVVATCLLRDFQPLVRYRLGDLAAWSPDRCRCGRAMPILKEVVGRVEDVLVGPDGREMVRFHGVFLGMPKVHEGQVIQESLETIRVRVVASKDFGDVEVQAIGTRVRERLGPHVAVVVEVVDGIPRLPSGKFKAVVSNLVRGGGTFGQTGGI